MVAIVSGNNLGLNLTSLATLGQQGVFGTPTQGSNGERVYVNAATGNLVLQSQDDVLLARGNDAVALRTYNSLGLLNDDNGDNWSSGFWLQPLALTGTLNAAGSTLQRTDRDGSVAVYAFVSTGLYRSTDGARAHDTLAYVVADNQWEWRDGATGNTERYEAGGAYKLLSSRDTSGSALNYSYNAAGRLAAAVTASGDATYYEYVGNNLAQIRTVTGSGASNTDIRYAYDSLNRLATVTVDLTPEDNSIADAKVFTTTYTYEGSSLRLARAAQSDGSSLTFTYDSARQLIAQSNTRQQSLAYTYDAAGQMTKILDAAMSKVTRYTYDLGGRKVRETTTQQDITYQDNFLAYDALGNLRDVADARAHIAMEYDKVGNRTRITNSVGYKGAAYEVNYGADRYFKYDAMNRQVVVDAVDAAGNIGTQGHLIEYDKNGNRTKDTFYGTRIVRSSGGDPLVAGYNPDDSVIYNSAPVTFVRDTGLTTEVYHYDALNRLSSVTKDEVQVDLRRYDGADRVVQSGVGVNLPGSNYTSLINQNVALGEMNGKERRQNRYDANGRLMVQSIQKPDGGDKVDIWWDPSVTIIEKGVAYTPGGYDDAGNVRGYVVQNHEAGIVNMYSNEQVCYEGYQVKKTPGASSKLLPGYVEQTYDVNGFLTDVHDASQSSNDRSFVNDSSGRALFVKQGVNVQRQLIVNGEVLGTYGAAPNPNPGGSAFVDYQNFNFSYARISASYPAPSPGAYQVRAGDTLQSIAQSSSGDSSLWYRIAEANGLGSSKDLKVGATLNIPNRVSTISNNNSTFKPYDPSQIEGDKTPNLAMPKNQSGCGGVGTLIMVIVAVVATILTAGAAALALGATATGTGLTAVVGAGMTALGSSISLSMLGAAVGSIVSQGVGMAIGAQSKFSWKSVGLSSVSGGMAAGLAGAFAPAASSAGEAGAAATQAGSAATSTVSPLAVAGRAVLANAATQGIGVMTGLQSRFDWRGVAASFGGAFVGAAVGNGMNEVVGSGLVDQFARRSFSGLAAGVTAQVMRGGRVVVQQVAADAFGNALGSSFANVMTDNPTRVTGAGKFGDLGEYSGQGVKVSPFLQVDAWGPTFNVPGEPLARTDWGLFSDGAPKLRSSLGVYGGYEDVAGIVDPETGATAYPVRTPVIESYPLPPMAPLPRRPMREMSAGQYVYGRVVEAMDTITERLDRMGEDPSTSSAVRFAVAMTRNPAGWIPDAVKGLTGVGGYALDSEFRGQINAGVSDFFGNDPVGTTKVAAARYWNENTGLEIARDAFSLMAGGSIGAPLAKLPGLALGETASLLGKAGETGLRWAQRINDYSLELASVSSMRYQAGAIGLAVRDLRAEVTQMLPEGFELQRISRGGAAIVRYGEDTYYSVPKAQYRLIPELLTMDTMGDVFTARVQRIADRFDLSMLSREQQLRLIATPDGWMKDRFLSAYKGSNVHTTFGRDLQLMPGGSAYSYSGVGPDVVSRIGGTGLKYEITQLTPSLNAIYTHTKRYPDQLLRYVTYR